MAEHGADILWERGEQDFLGQRYSRRHHIRFDGGTEIAGSSSPHVVPLPWSDASAVDPEEAFVASLSSCHMLWFLDIASRAGWVVDDYRDEALGVMAPNGDGKLAMTLVTLRPAVKFGGENKPDAAQLQALHREAHSECFIANSVKSEVRCEPVV